MRRRKTRGHPSRSARPARNGRVISAEIALRGHSVQRRLPVLPIGDEAFKYFALVINGAPEIMIHSVELHENLVEMTTPTPEIPHRLDAAAPDLGSKNHPEPFHA